MGKGMAQSALYGGAITLLVSAFAEAATAQTWAEVFTPVHVFGMLGAAVTALGAFYHPSPTKE